MVGHTAECLGSRELEGARKPLPHGLQREPGPADALILDTQPPELGESKFLWFNHPGCYPVLRQPQETSPAPRAAAPPTFPTSLEHFPQPMPYLSTPQVT